MYALGEKIEYEISVTNSGNLTVKNIEVNDELTNNELEEIAKDEFLSECSYEWKIYKK